jgi:microcystin degradation protein MlrC
LRIALALIMQETHSFSPLLTGIEEFRHSPLVPLTTGDDIVTAHRHAESEMGGFIKACEDEDVEMVPLMATFAVTSGPVTAEAFGWLQSMLLERLREAGQVDGVLIAQHGAMAAEGIDDPEGELLASIRALLGPDVPVGCSLDLHANLTQNMVDHAHILVSYETHIDYRHIGERTARLLFRCIREGLKPVHYLRKLPLVRDPSSCRTVVTSSEAEELVMT